MYRFSLHMQELRWNIQVDQVTSKTFIVAQINCSTNHKIHEERTEFQPEQWFINFNESERWKMMDMMQVIDRSVDFVVYICSLLQSWQNENTSKEEVSLSPFLLFYYMYVNSNYMFRRTSWSKWQHSAVVFGVPRTVNIIIKYFR